MEKIVFQKQIPITSDFSLYPNKKIGSGAFGDIYMGINTKTSQNIAIKCESVSNPHKLLKREASILNYLQGGVGIPQIYSYFETKTYNLLLMELLGPSLENLLSINNKPFSLKTILSLGEQMICRIEFIHSRHIIHRDIKPDNFLIGINNKKYLAYIIDFGLSKRFRDPKTGMHIPYKDGNAFIGTSRYASIYTHLGIEQSRRDDLESLAYSLIYLYKGALPWKGIKAKIKNEKYQKVLDIKISTSYEELCKNMPDDFVCFLKYIRDLNYDEKPNYKYLKELLGKMYDKNNFSYDTKFEFIDILEKKEKEKQEISNVGKSNKKILLTNDKKNTKNDFSNNYLNKSDNNNNDEEEKNNDLKENKNKISPKK